MYAVSALFAPAYSALSSSDDFPVLLALLKLLYNHDFPVLFLVLMSGIRCSPDGLTIFVVRR